MVDEWLSEKESPEIKKLIEKQIALTEIIKIVSDYKDN